MAVKLFSKGRWRFGHDILIVFIAFSLILLTGILIPGMRTPGENLINDIFFRIRYLLTGRLEIAPDINIFNLDDSDVTGLGLTLFSRQVYNEILTNLLETDTKGIFFDILFKDSLNSGEDRTLTDLSLRAGNAYFPLVLKSEPSPDREESGRMEKWLIYPRNSTGGRPYIFNSVILPFTELADAAAFLGAINNDYESYNRLIPLLYQYNRGYVPSLILLAVLACYRCPAKNITIEWGKFIEIPGEYGNTCRIPIDNKGRMRINYPAPYSHSFSRYTFRKINEVIADKRKKEILLEGLKDSLIFIVDSSTARNDFGRNVYDKNLPLNEVLVAAVNTVLTGEYLSSPDTVSTLAGFLFWLGLYFYLYQKVNKNKFIILILLSSVLYLACSLFLFIYFNRTFNFILFLGMLTSVVVLVLYHLLFLRRLTETLFSNQILSGRKNQGLDFCTSVLQQLLSPLTIIESRIKDQYPADDMIEYLELSRRIIHFLTSRNQLKGRQPKFGKPVLMDISSCLEGIIRLYKPYAHARGIDLQSAIDPDLYIRGMRTPFEMLIILITEHFIHMNSNGRIELNLKAQDTLVLLDILNTGSGLPESLVAKINNKEKNAGKKWMLFRKICAALNAEYKVSSWANAGTRIEITLPRMKKTSPARTLRWPRNEEENTFLLPGENDSKPVFYIINTTSLLKKYIRHTFDKEYTVIFPNLTELNPALFSDSLCPAAILFDMDGLNPKEAEQAIVKLLNIAENDSAVLFLCGSEPAVLHNYYMKYERINGYRLKPFSIGELQKEIRKWFIFRENCFDKNQERIKKYLFTSFIEDNITKEQEKIHKMSIFAEDIVLLKRLLEGKRNDSISRELNISINTLKKRIRKIYKKCGVKNKSELIAYFHNHRNS